MTVEGNLAFQSGALFVVQLTAFNVFANVTGTASLGGTLTVGSFPTFQASFHILHAAGGLGGSRFDGLSVPQNFHGTLTYTSTDVVMNVAAALGNGISLHPKHQSIANVINAHFNNGGALPHGFANLFSLSGEDLRNAHALLAGEAVTGAQQGAFQLTSQFLGLMLDPFVDGRGGLGGSGTALGFAPERAALPEDIALAYAKVTKAPVAQELPVYQPRWAPGAGASVATTAPMVITPTPPASSPPAPPASPPGSTIR